MSEYTRLACSDEQEEAIRKIEQQHDIVGGTTVGHSSRSTVILDLTHQGGEIRVSAEGHIQINKGD